MMMFPMFPLMIGFENKSLNQNMEPIRLYRLLQSICNFGKEEKVSTYDLARVGRIKIFDFNYPLSTKVNKEDFETNILNHYINRRIGFETPTAFKIALSSKLNEIMPYYNKLFDVIEDWNIFNDGEVEKITHEKELIEENTSNKGNTGTVINTLNGKQSNNNTETQNGEITKKLKNSDMPQSELSNVENADYLTNYSVENTNYDNLEKRNNQALNITQNSNRIDDLHENKIANKNQNERYTDIKEKSPENKIEIYKKYIEQTKSIYTLIYKDLDCLFYGLL